MQLVTVDFKRNRLNDVMSEVTSGVEFTLFISYDGMNYITDKTHNWCLTILEYDVLLSKLKSIKCCESCRVSLHKPFPR